MLSQAVLGPIRFFQSKLVRIHLLRQKGDDLSRPFKSPPNPVMKLVKEMKQEMGMTEVKNRKKKLKKPSDEVKKQLMDRQKHSDRGQ